MIALLNTCVMFVIMDDLTTMHSLFVHVMSNCTCLWQASMDVSVDCLNIAVADASGQIVVVDLQKYYASCPTHREQYWRLLDTTMFGDADPDPTLDVSTISEDAEDSGEDSVEESEEDSGEESGEDDDDNDDEATGLVGASNACIPKRSKSVTSAGAMTNQMHWGGIFVAVDFAMHCAFLRPGFCARDQRSLCPYVCASMCTSDEPLRCHAWVRCKLRVGRTVCTRCVALTSHALIRRLGRQCGAAGAAIA